MNYKAILIALIFGLGCTSAFPMQKGKVHTDLLSKLKLSGSDFCGWIDQHKAGLLIGADAFIGAGILYQYFRKPKPESPEQIKAKATEKLAAKANQIYELYKKNSDLIFPGTLYFGTIKKRMRNISSNAYFSLVYDKLDIKGVNIVFVYKGDTEATLLHYNGKTKTLEPLVLGQGIRLRQ